MEASWHQDGVENRTYLEKAAKQGMPIKPMVFNDFGGLGGPSGEQKSINNLSKNEANFERHLGIDFLWILVDFGRQVGRENRAKRHQIRHRKNDEKTKGNKMGKKSQ